LRHRAEGKEFNEEEPSYEVGREPLQEVNTNKKEYSNYPLFQGKPD